jgi:tetratricopeptide (TPR) repeat protein
MVISLAPRCTTLRRDGQLAINRKDYAVVGPAFWNNAISNAITIGLKITAEIPNYAEWGYPAPQGKQAVGSVIGDVVHKEGADAALRRYRDLEKDPAHYEFGARQLTILGRKLVEEGKLPEAVAILKFNTERYPDNAKAYEVLGDAELAVHDRAGAIAAYKRSLQLQPDNAGTIESLRALGLAPDEQPLQLHSARPVRGTTFHTSISWAWQRVRTGRDSISFSPQYCCSRRLRDAARSWPTLDPQNKLSHRYLFCGSVTRGVLP